MPGKPYSDCSKYSSSQLLQALADAGGNKAKAARALGVPRKTLCDHLNKYGINVVDDKDIVGYNISLSKKHQKLQDTQRIERKAFREQARQDNALEELLIEVKSEFKHINKDIKTKKHKESSADCEGIIQISDIHFNEKVDDVAGNRYDFTVSAQRLRKHVLESIRIFKAYGVKRVWVMFTADMFNSDRRLDELLSNATNRAKALLLGYDIVRQMLLELNQHFNVAIASITGNESRFDQIREMGNQRASNNFDFLLHEMLSEGLRDKKGFHFVHGDPTELIVEVNGQNILLIHGDNKHANNPFEMASKLMAKYSAKGINIRYVLSGHIHMAYISDYFARSSSTVGANAYSEKGLQLTSRASQNCYVVEKDGSIHGIKIDLQQADHVEGYNINKRLEAYNAKSADKLYEPVVIHQVTI